MKMIAASTPKAKVQASTPLQLGQVGLMGNPGFELGHDLFFEHANESGIDRLVDFEKGQPVEPVELNW